MSESEKGKKSFQQFFVGVNEQVPVVGGRMMPYINFDNAASTPALTLVLDVVNIIVRMSRNGLSSACICNP